MWIERVLVILAVFAGRFGNSQDASSETTTEKDFFEEEKKISEYILEVVEHFKKPDPVGFPGTDIPDPLPVPDMKQTLAFGTALYFKGTAVHGISKFRVLYVNINVDDMEAHAGILIDDLQTRGNYSYPSWPLFIGTRGSFTVNVTRLKVSARATLGVQRDGKLKAEDISIDPVFKTLAVKFSNLDLLGNIFQGIINNIGTFLFDSIKPLILQDAYKKLRANINSKLEELTGDIQFPNTLSPLDMVIVDARNKMRDTGLDPYRVKDYDYTNALIYLTLSNTWITGISTFHRIGNITFKMENNTVVADLEIGTQNLEGTTQWDISSVGAFVSRAGYSSFSVEYISGRMILAQPLDTREKSKLRDLNIDVGNIQVRCDGAGTLDYALELSVNILPNILRYQIINALLVPIKVKLQEQLNGINVEEVIKQKLPIIDQIEETEFKLSSLRELQDTASRDKLSTEDEFFNF